MRQIDKSVHRAEFDIYTIQYLNDAQTDQAFDNNIDAKYHKFYNNEYYRNLLQQYNWFYNYYIHKYVWHLRNNIIHRW